MSAFHDAVLGRPSIPHRPVVRPRTVAILFGFLVTLSGCAAIRVDAELAKPRVFRVEDTYAWLDAAPAVRHGARGVEDATVSAALRREVDTRLASLGMVRVDPHAAHFHLRHGATVRERLVSIDPYSDINNAYVYEDGTLTVELREATTGETVWRGSGTSRLRTVARSMGMYELVFVPVDEERDWKVGEKVSAIFDEFPRVLSVEEVSEPATRPDAGL